MVGARTRMGHKSVSEFKYKLNSYYILPDFLFAIMRHFVLTKSPNRSQAGISHL